MLRAAVEVRKPSIFGELIIALTFVPIAALAGMEGKMFSPLAFTVALALLSSLLLSIFVIPTVCLLVLRPVHATSPVFEMNRRLYMPALRWALAHRVVMLVIALVPLTAALVALPRLGTEFIPVMDEGAFDMDVQMLPSVSLDNAIETSREIERRLKPFPELGTIVSRTGQTGVSVEAGASTRRASSARWRHAARGRAPGRATNSSSGCASRWPTCPASSRVSASRSSAASTSSWRAPAHRSSSSCSATTPAC